MFMSQFLPEFDVATPSQLAAQPVHNALLFLLDMQLKR